MDASSLKIAYISGPANVRVIYSEWRGKDQQAYFGTDYMKQFLQVAKDVGAQAYIVTWYGTKRESFQLGDFKVDNRPITPASGLGYYIQHLLWHLRLLFKLIAYGPHVLLLTGNQNFWWVLSPLRFLGTRIIISYHSVLWPKLRPTEKPWALMVKLNGLLILRHAKAVLVTSCDIRRQVEKVLGAYTSRVDILDHLPSYSHAQFEGISRPPSPTARPFRILFLGRMVENKGIFDIVETARQLETSRPKEYRFDLCGDGIELGKLRQEILDRGLSDTVFSHGSCSQQEVRPLLDASHIMIVPTRTDCEAGFEMTCAESILAGRPLIASRVCPALDYVAEAAMQAEPDNPSSYREAIIKLSTDPELYERKRRACAGLQQQFYDPANSWYSAMKRALDRHILLRRPRTRGSVTTTGNVATGAGG